MYLNLKFENVKRDFPKIAKIGTQQEKPVLTFKNHKNLIPRKNAKKKRPIRKNKLQQNLVSCGVACSCTNSY